MRPKMSKWKEVQVRDEWDELNEIYQNEEMGYIEKFEEMMDYMENNGDFDYFQYALHQLQKSIYMEGAR